MSTIAKNSGATPSAHGFRTLAVHGGRPIGAGFGSLAPPIFSTSTFGYDDFDAGALLAIQSGQSVLAGDAPPDLSLENERGYIYSRLGNPTVAVFERRIAVLENGGGAVAFSSGMAAITSTILALVSAGEQVIYVGTLYGGTESVMREMLPRFGVKVRQVDTVAEIEQAANAQTRLVYVETPSNPKLDVHNLELIVKAARRAGILSVADNTFATPYLTRPLELGIDVVVHSATKYISGHGDATGGVAIASNVMSDRIRTTGMKHLGGCMSPHEAFMLIRGLKTLPLRMDASCETAAMLAEMLTRHPKIERVYYPGLEVHPGHALAKNQMSKYGAILSFDMRGGIEAAKSLLDGLELITQAVSVGDVDSLACHPATTTHSAMSESSRLRSGITGSLVRLSIGTEDGSDLARDVEQALEHV